MPAAYTARRIVQTNRSGRNRARNRDPTQQEPLGLGIEESEKFQRAEFERWREVVRISGARLY